MGERWLDTRLAPGGPLHLIVRFQRAAQKGQPDELRAASEMAKEMGSEFVQCLDDWQSPVHDKCLAAGETPPALWTWGMNRLDELTAAEEVLDQDIEAANIAIDCTKTDIQARDPFRGSAIKQVP